MRKQLITVLFLGAWLCQLSGRYFVMLDFYINQDYIAKNLCVNRDKPMMHCNGKCHLKKKLNEEDKKEHESPERSSDKTEIFYAAWYRQELPAPFMTSIARNYVFPYCIGTPEDRPTGVFHPPTA